MYSLPFDIQEYVERFQPELPEILDEIERQTHLQTSYPQMLSGKIQAGLLYFLTKLMGAREILEIGTFTGYSSIAMAAATDEKARVTTIEQDEKNLLLARSFIEQSGMKDKITVLEGNATDILPSLNRPFDFIFLDADKENYPLYYKLLKPLLKKKGLWVTDNVLWNGKVLSPQDEASRGIARFNELVQKDKELENYLLPIRDGLMLIRKK